MSNSPFVMSISLNVLNHMGLYLYSNTPAVLAEAIANAWDADATEVRVKLDRKSMLISVEDNGIGMDLKDINEKFLYVGYRKRVNGSGLCTSRGRKPMGRKGIGKLSLFSIANKISVYSKKSGQEGVSFLMDAEEITDTIENEDPSKLMKYRPKQIPFKNKVSGNGTVLEISDLKKSRITSATISGLRKRIARRFSIIGDDFNIYVDDEEVTFQDRDYFHKARFMFQYANDYSSHCKNLDIDSSTELPMKYDREFKFDHQGRATKDGELSVGGWIAIARRSNDLDGGNHDDNLNKISIVVRGKLAQEDILHDIRIGGMISKYMFGEISADFLDEDGKDDIATSSRQSISENDPRFIALKNFLIAN